MKKVRVIVNLIASWQLLLGLGFLVALVIHTMNGEYWMEVIPSRDFEITYSEIIYNIMTLFATVYVFSGLSGSTGILLKKEWGRILSYVPSSMMMVYGLWLLWERFAPYHHYDIFSIFVDTILPIVISSFIFLTGLLPVIFLTRPHVKEYFKKPQIKPGVPVSSN